MKNEEKGLTEVFKAEEGKVLQKKEIEELEAIEILYGAAALEQEETQEAFLEQEKSGKNKRRKSFFIRKKLADTAKWRNIKLAKWEEMFLEEVKREIKGKKIGGIDVYHIANDLLIIQENPIKEVEENREKIGQSKEPVGLRSLPLKMRREKVTTVLKEFGEIKDKENRLLKLFQLEKWKHIDVEDIEKIKKIFNKHYSLRDKKIGKRKKRRAR